MYSKLNSIKSDNKALWNANKGGSIEFINQGNQENVLALIRTRGEDKVLALFNISVKETQVNINSHLINGNYYDFETDKPMEIKDDLNYLIKPWSYKLYYTKR